MKSLLTWTERRLLRLFRKLSNRQNFHLKAEMFSFHSKYFVYRELKRAPQKLSFCFKCPGYWYRPDTGQHTVPKWIYSFRLTTEYMANFLGIFVGVAPWLDSPDWRSSHWAFGPLKYITSTEQSRSRRAANIYTFTWSLNFTLLRLFYVCLICLISFSFFKHLSWLASDRATSV